MLRTLPFALLGIACLFGQGTATIVGTVTDSSGAVVPSAQLTLVNEATGVARQATADPAGRFDFTRLPVGNYRLAATVTGFKRSEMRSVNLTAEQTLQLNLVLDS